MQFARLKPTCRAKVFPLVRKLCSANILSLRVIACEALSLEGNEFAEQIVGVLPVQHGTRNMQC